MATKRTLVLHATRWSSTSGSEHEQQSGLDRHVLMAATSRAYVVGRNIMAIVRTNSSKVAFTVALVWFSTAAGQSQDCSGLQATVSGLRSKIKADQDAIRRLNPALTANELSKWADATEEERQ